MRGLAHVGDHRGQQVRNTFVDRHLQHLGVDHQQAHIAGFGLVEQRQNHGVDTDRLTRAGGTRHQHVGHLGQIGHHRVANDVLAQPHGQHGLGLVIDLRAQYFAQLDRLAFGIGQLQRHEVFARNGFDHSNRHQAERTRQVFGQVHHLRAFDARGRLNLVTRNHRAWGRSHHAHLDTKILELFLNQAAGHLQRLGRHCFLPDRQTVEQIHLRQLAVGQFCEQWFLTLFDHPVTARHIHDGRLNHHRWGLRCRDWQRLQIQLPPRRWGQRVHVPLRLNGLLGHGLLTFAQSLLAQCQVFLNFSLFVAGLDQAINAPAHHLGQLAPRKAEHHRNARDHQRDPHQCRTRKAKPAHADCAHQITQCAATVARQMRLQAVQTGPLDAGACRQQNQQADPESPTTAPLVGRRGRVLSR